MYLGSKLYEIFEELKISIPQELVETALTHSSKTHEDKKAENYERLEFLGDSVLKLLMSEYLYKEYPQYPEGRMTKIRSILVSDNILYQKSKEIDLQSIVILGTNEEQDGGREKESVVACAFEAILGAIYLSNGIEKADKFLKYIFKDLPSQIDKNLEFYNAKAVLQEYTQGKSKDLPKYVECQEVGKQHNKTFTYEVYYNDDFLASGEGKTKKEAQQNAAQKACIKLGIIDNEVKNG